MTESRRVVAFAWLGVVLGVAALVAAWRFAPPRHWVDVVLLVALCVVGTHSKVRRLIIGVDVDLSVNSIVQLAALALAGPAGAMVVGGAPWLIEARRCSATVRAFNVALPLLTGGAAAVAYWAAGGSWVLVESLRPAQILTDLALPMLAADLVMCLVNIVLLAAVISLDERVPYREVVVGMVRGSSVAYVGYGIFGLLLTVLWGPGGVGPLSAVLVLAPLFVARWAFAQYAAQHEAHERTVAALVSAVEAKDRYTRGHSERVARASMMIGRAVGLSPKRTSTLHFAGMLHDVGKLGVPTRVLQKTGALTDEEFAAIARHPLRGLEMVREIEFLGEALQGILHHHERLDGRGYPLGLAGHQIPEFARIIAVADAFDSMTSTRSYRQARSVREAVGELRTCAGTQFDPTFVQALSLALERTDWEPVTGDPLTAATGASGSTRADPPPSGAAWQPGPAARASYIDHDDPDFFWGMDDDLGPITHVGPFEEPS